MKKILLILALVAVYGISLANAPVKVNSEKAGKICVASDDQSNFMSVEEEKDKKKKTEEKAKSTEKVKETKDAQPTVGGCGEAQKKCCAAAGKSCPEEKASKKETGGGSK